jgi:hypothetical protein
MYLYVLEYGGLVQIPNSAYVPLEFRCNHESCSCMVKYNSKYPI